MKNRNKNLTMAKRVKNDEFYTRIEDIDAEISKGGYERNFRNKTILCNCDDPDKSAFWKYFELKFEPFHLSKLISTHYDPIDPGFTRKLERSGSGNITQLPDEPLTQNGDFRSDECINILKQTDIVVTNPPFSLFREYMRQLIKYEKKFLIIGNLNAVAYIEIFPLIRDNKIWLGCTSPKEFAKPGGDIQKFGNIYWFTNLEVKKKRNKYLILYKTYNSKDYPKYDNYDAIEVSRVADIPMDYEGVMGVPISFFDKYSPDQFELLGCNIGLNQDKNGIYGRSSYVNGKRTFERVFIRNRTPK